MHSPQLNAASLISRLMLCHNEVLRLPAASQGAEVVSGVAWVTVNGRDIFLASGERLWLPSPRDPVLISALGRNPLILEVFGATSVPLPAALVASHQGKNYGA